METRNLTFRQQLILAITKEFVVSQIFESFTDDVVDRIKQIADKLSEPCPENESHPGILDEKLKDFGIRNNHLFYNGIITFRDLIQKTPADLLRIRNFGRSSLTQVEDVLEHYGLKLKGR